MPAQKTTSIIAGILAALLPATHALAQDAIEQNVAIELNKLEELDNGCRAYLKIENARAEAFNSLELDLVTFQPDGVIGSQFLVELAPVPANKTVVKPFELQSVTCASIASVLLNDVPTCMTSANPPSACIDVVDVTSLTSKFWK
ncbi:MAG: hypothetical protein AAFY56_13820 [Pseudomonadota bacterium]